MAYYQPQTGIIYLMHLVHVVLWAKMQFAMSEIQDTQ